MNKQIVNRAAFVRESSAEMVENRQVEFVISSEAVDSYGTVFKMDGWKLDRYANNPIVCYQHRSNSDNPDDIIGTSEVFVEDNKLIGRVTFEDATINAKAEKVFRKVLAGTLKMASVGAMINDGRMGDKTRGEDESLLYFTDQHLVEWSIVSAGANPDALKRNEEIIEIIRKDVISDIEVIETEIKENKSRTISAFEAQILINN
jgi:phage head maturation protease